ncbi:MAG: polyribonucleotide nucleotidyltransferase [Nitrospirae bacterium]|nr:polyribonucleotide nucleotidyltransferase [Nitrospirota bacterium]
MIKKVELKVRSNSLVLETGKFAKQADGSVIVKYGDTMVLATVVAKKEARKDIDFFPLTIDYQEKTYAAGKIPGGFFKREGRATEKETLTSRLIDRPTRPLFPDGFYSETQGIVSVLSFGEENISDILGIIGMSAALSISNIPFDGPVGAVRVGILGGSFILNPNLQETDSCDFSLVVAGTENAVMMVEGGGTEVSEAVLLQALELAHNEIKRYVQLQKDFVSIAGKEKRTVTPPEANEELLNKISSLCIEKIKGAITIPDKLMRQSALDIIKSDAIAELNTAENDISRDISSGFEKIEKDLVRNMILEKGLRADGRKPDEVRKINCDVGILPRAHGSALFQRGETQALTVVTLGTSDDEQRIDSLEGEYKKAFMLHYNFPPFSVGEVKSLRGAGRREIGHGMLAERALKTMLPARDKFPYTIRIVSDILESNGSSSMATVCGGTMALMDAGVPIKAPVAGIAMGLIKEGDKTVVLTDILGLEDHLGDMDFKVTGTSEGITAFQMDVKISDVTKQIMEVALEQAKKGRLHILGKMNEVLTTPREDLAKYAPRIYTMMIKTDKIRDIIGTGGKVIRGIIEETGAKINVDDTGLVSIASNDEASAQKAIDIIKGILEEPEMGKIYNAKVMRVVDFGAFVEILPGKEALLHISQISNKRVENVSDEIKEGDVFPVKVIKLDKTGKVGVSRKDAMPENS